MSVLHHLSIKRAIQVLRINNFEPNCLRRRPSDEVASEVEVYTAYTFRACDCPCGDTRTHFFLEPSGKESVWFPQSLKSSLIYFSGFVFLYSFLSPRDGSTCITEAKDCVLVFLPPFLGVFYFPASLSPKVKYHCEDYLS